MALPDKLQIMIKRTGSTSGRLATPSEREAFSRAVRQDLGNIFNQLNEVYYVTYTSLVSEPGLDALDTGLAGDVILTSVSATSGSAPLFWNAGKSRPRTVKESMEVVLTEISRLENAIAAINNITISVDAGDVFYNNTTSGLGASDVQAAIDELKVLVDAVGSVAAIDVSYDPSANDLVATNVQDAFDEIMNGALDILKRSGTSVVPEADETYALGTANSKFTQLFSNALYGYRQASPPATINNLGAFYVGDPWPSRPMFVQSNGAINEILRGIEVGELLWNNIATAFPHNISSIQNANSVYDGLGGNVDPHVYPYGYSQHLVSGNRINLDAEYSWAGFGAHDTLRVWTDQGTYINSTYYTTNDRVFHRQGVDTTAAWKPWKEFIFDSNIASYLNALETTYDNSGSGLAATNVKAALDELDSDITAIKTEWDSSGGGIWMVDATPAGLDAVSYRQGDGTGGWVYDTIETGAMVETDFGLSLGTMTGQIAVRAFPNFGAESSFTAYFAMDTNINVSGESIGFIFGDNLGTTALSAADYYAFTLRHDGTNPEINVRRFVGGTFSTITAEVTNVGKRNGVYLRATFNSGKTSAFFAYSMDGMSWTKLNFSSVAVSGTLDSFGIYKSGSSLADFHIPWVRVRQGGTVGSSGLDFPEGRRVNFG